MLKKTKMKVKMERIEGYEEITIEKAMKVQRGSRGMVLLFL